MDEKMLDMGVISSSWTPEKYYEDRALITKIRSWSRNGVMLCGLDTGAFILAHAGLLKHRAATVHYEHFDTFQEVYPDVQPSENLYVIDENFLSTGGGVASIDLALQLIQRCHGKALANASARYIFHDRLRSGDERQNNVNYEPYSQTAPEKLQEAILLMEQNLEEPLTVCEIARQANISQRHLVRLFKRYTQHSAVQYYRDIRLDRGRSLVTQTNMSVLEIAVACGFGSVSHFSRAYRARFGITAQKDRVLGRVPFEFRAWPMHPKG
jgi:AraC family carnitine catabolism transcriptional activator